MDISVVSLLPPGALALDTARAPMARGPQSQSKAPVDGAGNLSMQKAIETAAREMVKAVMALRGIEMPRNMMVRAELGVDEASRRVFARIFDRETGELVVQFPAEEALRLWGVSREQFGRILNTDA